MIKIRTMTENDYDSVYNLWKSDSGIALSSVDSREKITALLKRCPDISLIAEENNIVIGSVLGSEDTRRGYVHHLIVAQTHRKRGIGKLLMENITKRFSKAGIEKIHLFIVSKNSEVVSFYKHINWHTRPDIILMSKYTK